MMKHNDFIEKTEIDDPHHALYLYLRFVMDLIVQCRISELETYNIGERQATILTACHILGENATVKNISRWARRKHNSTWEMIKRMENKGLLKKITDKKNKKIVRMKLTKAGQDAYQKVAIRESIKKIMSSITDEQKQDFLSTLNKIKKEAETVLSHYHQTKYAESIESTWFLPELLEKSW